LPYSLNLLHLPPQRYNPVLHGQEINNGHRPDMAETVQDLPCIAFA
jgi:hypothetical protein